MEIDWHRIFFGDQPYLFFLEVLFRTVTMFVVVVIILRLAGKRSVQQLSIFEIVMIITLGSAAGDPMLYEDVGLLHAILVFIIILAIYRLLVFFISKNEKVEEFLEGKATYIIKDGMLCIDEISGNEFGSDEFFAALRERNIEHFGQVRYAILEDTGIISVFYYADDQVRPGLPILPAEYNKKGEIIEKQGTYSCTYCGNTMMLMPTKKITCERCGATEWVKAIARKRIT